MPACLNCHTEFAEAPRRGPRPKTFCSRPCQIKSANERRSVKRRGSAAERPCDLSTAGETPGRPPPSTLPDAPAKAQTPLSGHASTAEVVDRSSADARLQELMTLAHSPRGIDAWGLAELAKLRGISPWAPARVIMAKEPRK